LGSVTSVVIMVVIMDLVIHDHQDCVLATTTKLPLPSNHQTVLTVS